MSLSVMTGFALSNELDNTFAVEVLQVISIRKIWKKVGVENLLMKTGMVFQQSVTMIVMILIL